MAAASPAPAPSTKVTNGVATYTGCSFTTGSATPYTLSATSGTLAPATSTVLVFGPATKLVYTSPPPATVNAGTTFTVVVAEEDAFNNVETSDSTTALALAANNGGGGFSCTTTPTTVTNGVATYSGCSYKIASATAYTLSATSGTLTPATAITTVSPGAASKLVYTTPPPATVNAGTTFSVVVAEQDANGNTLTGDSTTALALAANNGGGGFSCTTTPTKVTNGVATYTGCSYTIASATPYTLSATSGTLTPATATTTVSAGVATKLVYTTPPPANVNAGTTFTVVVAEQDADGNTLTGDSTTALTLTASGGNFTCTATPTKVTNGVATYTGCSYTVAPGSYTLTAASGALTHAVATTSVTPGAASKLVYTTPPPATVNAGTTFSVVVIEQDAYGNTLTGDSTTALALGANNGGGGFSCTTTPTKVTNGVATYTGCSYTIASATPYTLSATSGTLTPATATTTVSAGVATKLVYTTPPPANVNAGTTFTVVVAEQDADGNTLTGDSTTALTLTASGGNFTCTATPTKVTNGVATYTGCSYTVAPGSYTLTAASGALTHAVATTNVAPGVATKLVYTTAPPAATTAGTTFTVVVAEQDADGNTLTGDSTTALTLTASGGNFTCTTTPTKVTNGVATYTGCKYTIARPTAYTLTAASGTLTPATATTLVSHAPASKIVFTTTAQTFESGTTGATGSGTITIQAQDPDGNPVAAPSGGWAVTLASNSGTGTFTPASPLTIAAGTSSVNFVYHDTKAGTPVLTATAAALANPTATQTETVVGPAGAMTVAVSAQTPNPVAAGSTATYTVTVTNNLGATHDIGITAIDGLPTGAGGTITSAACVRTTSGNTATFTLSAATGAATPNSTSTIAVVATAYVSNFGSCSIGTSATAEGTGTLAVTAPAAQLIFSQQPTTTVHGVSITPAVTVLVVDANYSVVTSSNATVTIAIGTNPGTGTLSGTLSVAAVNGVATFSTLKLSTAGTGYTLAATATGLTSTTSNAFNVT